MQTVAQRVLTDRMEYQGTPVLNCTIRYPHFTSTCSREAARTVNEYYRSLVREKGRYCRTVLYPQAVKDETFSRSRNFPFFPYEFDISYQVTYNADCLVSLYLDQYEFMGGAHGSTLRTSQTWDFETGQQLQLSDFFPHNTGFIQELQSWIEHVIAERLLSNPDTYFDDYPKLLRDTFQAGNFYLISQGIVLYYQHYDIAPYSSGIPEFLLPFADGPQRTETGDGTKG